MAHLQTAERVSTEASDNFVFQRSLLAYHEAAKRISGEVLEIGTGSGYGIEILSPKAQRFVTIDKHRPEGLTQEVEFLQAKVPPLPFQDESFDFVVSFQVIEHIPKDETFLKEVHRVLRKGGKFIVTTPNAPMSLTRNPWHVREYTAEELTSLMQSENVGFQQVEMLGVSGNEKVMDYYEKNREGVRRITRFDIFDLQHRLPRQLLQIPYDLLNRFNRRKLLKENQSLTTSILMSDYRVEKVSPQSFDLFFIAQKAE